jgi:hypothetical protein
MLGIYLSHSNNKLSPSGACSGISKGFAWQN